MDSEIKQEKKRERREKAISDGTISIVDLANHAESHKAPKDVEDKAPADDWLESVPLATLKAANKPKETADRKKPKLQRKQKKPTEGDSKKANQRQPEKAEQKDKKKADRKTARTGKRPCAKCLQAAVRGCAECSDSVDPFKICSARKTEGGFELALMREDGGEMGLCVKCRDSSARTFEQLGTTEWERALGKAKHCAACTPDRHPPAEGLAEFRRVELAKLRKDEAAYAKTSRADFDRQQKALHTKSAKARASKLPAKVGCLGRKPAPQIETGGEQGHKGLASSSAS